MKHSHSLALLLASPLLTPFAAAQGELVLTYGAPVPGASTADPLNSLRAPTVGNDGTWAVLAGNVAGFPQNFAANLLVKNGTVLLEERVTRVDGELVVTIETPRVLDDGRVLSLCEVGSLSSAEDAVILDDEMILRRGDTVVDASGGVLGTVGGIREAHVTGDGRLIALAFVREPSGASSLRVLAKRLGPSGAVPFSIFGPGDALTDGSTVSAVQGIDVAANGRLATYGTEFASDGTFRATYRVDGFLELQDGDAAPLAGGSYVLPSSTFPTSAFAVSADGRFGLLGRVETAAAETTIIASGGVLLAEVGDAPVGSSGPAIGSVAGLGFDMTDDGHLVWVARDVNDDYGVYLDSERLIAPGMEIAGSTLVSAGRGMGQPGFVSPLSTNGGFLTEIVELSDGRSGLLVLQRSIGEFLSCGTVAHSGGVTAEIDATGSDLAGGNPLTLVASDLPLGVFGIFVTSRTFDPTGSPVAGGQLCLGGTLGRIPSVLSSGSSGMFSLDVDTQRLPQAILTAAQAGETWYFQTWFRDAMPTPTANFSSAVGVTFR